MTGVAEDIRAQASRLPWFQSIALTPDFTTLGTKSAEQLAIEEEAFLGALDLRGASLIEIGSWNGYFAFAAKRRGAVRIAATDKFVWQLAGGAARRAFDLAHACIGEGIDVVEIDPTELPGPLQPADVMLFTGVFYHLWDPLIILQKIAALTRDVLILETHMDACYLTQPAMVHYPGRELQDDPTNWWGPNIACVYALLKQVGFGGRIIFSPGYRSSLEHPIRGVFRAFRNKESFERRFSGTLDNRDALFDLSDDAVREKVIGTVSRNVLQWMAQQQAQQQHAARPRLTARLARAFRR
jgi:tRNA (mo5U34)-methyltransferase